MSKQKNDRGYLKLAQLLAALDIQSTLRQKYVEYNLNKEGNINFQIPHNATLGTTQPEFLGCTILHLTYKKDKLQLFNLLLNDGIDLSIKNSKGSTVLHQIIEDLYEKEAESSELKAIADNPFVFSLLNAIVKAESPCNPCNEKGITHFHIACMANHKTAVELFLKSKRLYNQTVFKSSSMFPGYTALHFAARFSSSDAVKMLLEYGAIHNIKDVKGMTPLHVLIKRNIEVADLLNKNDVVNAEHLTSQRKINENIIGLLLSKSMGPSDCAIDDTNLSWLHIACILESSQIAEFLLGSDTYMNQAVSCRSPYFAGNTALHFAALCNVEKVKLLLKKGANIHLKNAKGQTAFDLCLERYEIKDICDIIASQPDWRQIELFLPGNTLLDFVSGVRNFDGFPSKTKNEMINANITRNSSLWPSYSLLHVAVTLSERGCKNDQMIVANFQNSKTATCRLAMRAISPLHLAFRLKKEKVVNFLLVHCLSASNITDCDKLSHLHVACAAGVATAVEDLLLAGAKVNAPVEANFEWYRHSRPDSSAPREVFIPKGSTPLHIAVIVEQCETMKLLLDHGADVYAKDEHGMTPIHWLIVSDNPISPAADILLSTAISSTSSANANKRLATTFVLKECISNTGLSHLHVACFAGDVAAVHRLLEEGSDVNAISLCTGNEDAKKFPGLVRYASYTPLHFALERKDVEIVSLLVKCGSNVLMNNPAKKSTPLFEAITDKQLPCAEVLRAFFKSNKALQQQVEEYTGLTMLHFYCCSLDDEAAENLLSHETSDINKFMLASSPIWPGFTPLHVLIKSYQVSNRSFYIMVNLLLFHGADVKLPNAERNTPLHLACDLDVEAAFKVSLLQSLLRSQKNFDFNPQNCGRLSHFHIACILCDISAIQEFSKHDLDVNRPIECFYENRKGSESNGCTPLHLVLFHPLNQKVKITDRMRVVTALIRYGADVCVENVVGNTPLHLAAKYHPQCIELFKIIIDAGADIYAKNMLGQTSLEILLNSKDFTFEGVKIFLDRGYCANAFNPVTQKGLIAIVFSTHSYFQQQGPVFELMVETCSNVLDEMKRTVIHNVVSTSTPLVSDEFYTEVLESLVEIVNIDQQDQLGRTALHVATQFENHQAIFALLQAGADINVIDAEQKTAFAYAFESSPFFDGSQDHSETIVRIFSSHVQKLNVCGLEVHGMNHSTLIDAFKYYGVDANVTQCFYDELKNMKDVKIGSSSITLLNLISGTNAQSVLSCISELERNVIDNLSETIDETCFSESIGIIKLQCRKISRKCDLLIE